MYMGENIRVARYPPLAPRLRSKLPMRKCLVTLAIGDRHARIEALSRPLREHYARQHGYDYRVVSSMDEIRQGCPLPEELFPSGSDKPAWAAATQLKLVLPWLTQDVDFAVYMDADTYVNPDAPCLSKYAEAIPQGGFGAVQTVTNDQARRFFPLWAGDYYLALEHRGCNAPLPRRDEFVNGGLYVFRPKEVRERWHALLGRHPGFNEENLLNLYEVQQGNCLLLPSQWNVLWYYKKHTMGWLKPANSWCRFQAARMKNRLGLGERWLVNRCFATCHMIHFAFESKKMGLIDAAQWLSDKAQT